MNEHSIPQLVPHAGAMCLLDRIVSVDEREIVCATRSHRSPNNPLRNAGELAALHLAEYGAQAMAAHGGWQAARSAETGGGAPPTPRGGMLVAIRDLQLGVARLDDLEHELTIHAVKMVANADGQIYSFSARAGELEIGRGRVSVMLRGG